VANQPAFENGDPLSDGENEDFEAINLSFEIGCADTLAQAGELILADELVKKIICNS